MFKATGKTYNAKDQLKEVGFTFDPKTKEWYAISYNAERWAKMSNPTYSRTIANALAQVTITEFDPMDCI